MQVLGLRVHRVPAAGHAVAAGVRSSRPGCAGGCGRSPCGAYSEQAFSTALLTAQAALGRAGRRARCRDCSWVAQVVDREDVDEEDLPDDMAAIDMGDKCLMYRSSILEVGRAAKWLAQGVAAARLVCKRASAPCRGAVVVAAQLCQALASLTCFLQEKATAVNMLSCYAEELKEGYWAYARDVRQLGWSAGGGAPS